MNRKRNTTSGLNPETTPEADAGDPAVQPAPDNAGEDPSQDAGLSPAPDPQDPSDDSPEAETQDHSEDLPEDSPEDSPADCAGRCLRRFSVQTASRQHLWRTGHQNSPFHQRGFRPYRSSETSGRPGHRELRDPRHRRPCPATTRFSRKSAEPVGRKPHVPPTHKTLPTAPDQTDPDPAAARQPTGPGNASNTSGADAPQSPHPEHVR